jgi:hypothetical protein
MIEALSSSETSVLTRAAWRNVPEDSILYTTFNLFKVAFKFFSELRRILFQSALLIFFYFLSGRNISIGLATSYGLRGQDSIPVRGLIFFSAPQQLDWLWGTSSLP